jgi:8-oxo-dGTP pyrophosphatase MutT (NUDIX family)
MPSLEIVTYTAAGGVVTNAAGDQILLLIRPSRDEVRLPKGHVESEESPTEAALREVAEESGYSDIEIIADLGEQLVTFPLNQQIVRRTEHYYLMQTLSAERVERPDKDAEQFFAVWVSWREAADHLTFEAEQVWIQRARKAWEGQL